ncbi:hypothetical protein HDU76_002446 [Blyttiomyces sp. JEL0837]|nr:hypothetical protein HDU76_002446 [Blyttiomyces sp. JEL0837]
MHDDSLDRTTNGTGLVKLRKWKGYIEHLVTEDDQPIPRLKDMLELLMEDDAKDIFLLVDIKVSNGVDIIDEIARILKSYNYDFRAQLQLGVREPEYYRRVKQILPYETVDYIGYNLQEARRYFFDANNFKVHYPVIRKDKTGFIRQFHNRNRGIFVWPLSLEEDMIEAMDDLHVDGIVTDFIDRCLTVRRDGWRRRRGGVKRLD